MKPPANYALFYKFDLKALRKAQCAGSATLFRPCQQATGEWACRLVFQEIEREETEIYGEDSLQALMLALQCLRFLFERLEKRGVSVRYPGSKEEIDFDLYFHAFGKTAAGRNHALGPKAPSTQAASETPVAPATVPI